jgi:hypothetical protein
MKTEIEAKFLNKHLPKVIFEQMPLELETEMILSFLDREWGFKLTEKYPQFSEIQNIQSKEKKKRVIKNEIVKIRQELGPKMDEGLLLIKNNWQKAEKETLEKLAEIIQTDYLKKDIIAYISINPMCPRFLDKWSFSVPPNHKNPNKTITHEISHFLFFKKLKEDFPKIKRNKYESPHKEWIISEMLAVIILCDDRMLKALNIPKYYGYYPKHKELKINDELLSKLLENLYEDLVIQKKDFTEFIKKSLELLRELE